MPKLDQSLAMQIAALEHLKLVLLLNLDPRVELAAFERNAIKTTVKFI
jgi:hypothetical protein